VTAATLRASVLSPLEQLADALVDPARRERSMMMLLLGYALAWSLYAVLAKASQDLHVDMGEMIAWSHAAGMGTPKHPPLGAWLVRLWFTIMPRAEWAYYFFAMLMPAIALWVAWRLSADYLEPEKRVAGIALLSLVPFMNFHALKYNANTVLLPLWAATTWCFLRSFETRHVLWAALAGAGAAAAMLGKYWSVCLIAGLGLAAIADRRRGIYFRSPAPWVSVAVGLALLAPHLIWLSAHDFSSVAYIGLRHQETFWTALVSTVLFFVGCAAYVSPAVVGAFLAARPNLATLRDMLFPASPQRRLVNAAFFAPALVAATAALALRVEITALWMLPAATLLPVFLLSSPLVALARRALVALLAAAIVFPLIMIIAAPGIAMIIHRHGVAHHADHYRLLAQALEQSWRARTDKPLAIVGGDDNLANGVLFYVRGRALAYFITAPALSPSIDDTRIAREGIALVCAEEEQACMDALNARSARAGVQPTEITLVREYFGVPGRQARYMISGIPPSM
jgi:4-amino-4-deoxy-L-arabinose transferase-like glycosyltransferase